MKTKSRELGTWHASAVCAVVLIVLIGISLTLLAQGPPTKTVEFKTGKFEAKIGDQACSADLGSPGSDLEYYQGNVQVFGAHYSEKNCQVRLSVTNVKGPGTYGKANVFNFSLNWGPTQKAWNFNRRQDDCTFTFSKLDDGGAQGKVACTGSGPLTAATFSAAP